MDNNSQNQQIINSQVTNNQTIAEGIYNKLGKKVFWLFFSQNILLPALFLFIAIILFVLSFQNFSNTGIGNMQTFLSWATLIFFLLFLISFAIAYGLAYLEYSNFTFMLDADSLKIRRGIFNKTEGAVPYRQIQDVDIERDFFFQMLGLSRVIILTAGHEDEKSAQDQDESEGVIPAIDKNMAQSLQSQLLKKADIQKTINVQ